MFKTLFKFVVLPVAIVGGIIGIAHVASAATTAGDLPDSLKGQVQRALASADPVEMRSVAKQLRKSGYGAQAASLEKAASEVERGIKLTPAAQVARAVGGGVARGVRQLGAVTSEGLTVTQPRGGAPRSLAGQVALAFTDAKKYHEGADAQALLRTYQEQEKQRGFYKGNIDGLYGPSAAYTLADDHNIIPPPPLYWPKADPAGAKTKYRARMVAKAAKDPQRAEEWQQAAKV